MGIDWDYNTIRQLAYRGLITSLEAFHRSGRGKGGVIGRLSERFLEVIRSRPLVDVPF
jgi:hypothetical protein